MKLTDIKGVSEKREKDFASLGIYDTYGLVRHFPRNFLDLRKVKPLTEFINNEYILTSGTIISIPRIFTSASKRVRYVKIVCEQSGIPFTVIWFNQPYVLNKLKEGEEYIFYGRIKNDFGQSTITNPTFEPIDKNYKLKGIIPQYSLSGGLTQRIMRDCINFALRAEKMPDSIPEKLRKKYFLSSIKEAYRELHNPTSMNLCREAQERIALEEYYTLIAAFRFIKGDSQNARTNVYSVTKEDIQQFTSFFGFEFTEGQKNAVNEIFKDLKGANTMNRLIEGDVGSGKTAVALCGIYAAVKSGYQAVMLAPTEILAEQNYKIISKFFAGYQTAFLTGSLTVKAKREIKEKLASGEIRILACTHAVLQDDVTFKELAFCVCDEQHRFGVSQRSKLLSKGNEICDFLVMSATPIPRTLSLIVYGDLDVTVIKDKPKQRAEIQTNIVPNYKYSKMLKFIEEEVKAGHQAYFVCPKIDEDEEGTVMNVTELYQNLSAEMPNVKFALLHGKMKDKEKNDIMSSFKNKEFDCIVSTTVIEVGIDVPNATVMVIYDADRFGLSQLHQLRGRVGRSNLKSYCFLLTNSVSEKASERLDVLVKNNNGFDIADKDYEMRGSGDFLGVRQSGKFVGEVGNLNYSTETIMFAKRLCDESLTDRANIENLRKIAAEKYERLKDISLN